MTYLTKEQIVDDLYSKMDELDRDAMANLGTTELYMLHHGYGTHIRNEYKLWEKDNPLTKEWHAVAGTDHKYMDEQGVDCHPDHPDEVSFEIIKEVHKKAKNG